MWHTGKNRVLFFITVPSVKVSLWIFLKEIAGEAVIVIQIGRGWGNENPSSRHSKDEIDDMR